MEAFQPLSNTSDVSALFSIHGDLPLKHTRNFLGPNRTLGAETKLNCVTMRISFKYVRLVSFVDIFSIFTDHGSVSLRHKEFFQTFGPNWQ